MDFLNVFGLTTLSCRADLLERKRKKRRRMMRERSPSPIPAQKPTPPTPTPPPALSTRYSPEDMDSVPDLEDKKNFLSMFSLNHLSQEQRIEKEKVENLLDAIKQKTVTLDTLRYATHTPCSSPPSTASEPTAPSTPCQSNEVPLPHSRSPTPPAPHRHLHNNGQQSDLRRLQSDPPRLKEPPPLAPLQEHPRFGEVHPIRRPPSLQASPRPPLIPLKEHVAGRNGLTVRPQHWESTSAEEFAQQFHQSVLQSTQKTQHKHKGGVTEPNHRVHNSVHYNPSDHQGAPNRLPYSYTNGNSCHPAARPEPSGLSDERSAEEESSEEDDDDDEEESYGPKWKGIEAIYEAYHEYIEERSIESEVLQSECRRLEAQHYHLGVTADQLSINMGELLAQRQRLALERERMQAELEHFRKCLALPALHLHRGHYKGPPPR